MKLKSSTQLRMGTWTAPVLAGNKPLVMLDAGPGLG